jgi:hypothetical protein
VIFTIFILQILNIFLLTATFFSVALGLFVWWQNRKSTLHIIFGLLTIILAIWLFGTYMMFKNCTDEKWVVFWDRFIYLGVVWMPFLIYHFVIVLIQKIKEKPYKILVFLGYFLGFIFSLISRTDYFVKDVFNYKWGCHTVAQIGHHLFLIPFTLYISFATYELWNYLRKTFDQKLRTQLKYLFISFLFAYIGAIEFLPAYKISVFPIGYVFPLIWIGIVAYAIVSYQFLNVKIIATDGLIALIMFSLLAFTFFSENVYYFLIRGFFLFLIGILSWLAVKGVHREVREKERLELVVKEKTKELEEKTMELEKKTMELEKRKKELEIAFELIKREKEQLEKFYKITIGRELKMVELKKEIKELKEKLKKYEKSSTNNH